MYFACRHRIDSLVETQGLPLAQHRAASSNDSSWIGGRRAHGNNGTTSCRRSRTRVGSVDSWANADRRPGRLVLPILNSCAGESDVHLSTLEDRHPRMVAISISGRNIARYRLAVVFS